MDQSWYSSAIMHFWYLLSKVKISATHSMSTDLSNQSQFRHHKRHTPCPYPYINHLLLLHHHHHHHHKLPNNPRKHTHKKTLQVLAKKMLSHHVLLVTFPGQGHINPSLQFAKQLVKLGVHVTFFTSLSAVRRMTKTGSPNFPEGLTLASFSDGYDDGFGADDDIEKYMYEQKTRGAQAVKELIREHENEGRPFVRVVYCTLIAWAGKAARDLQVPSTLLWIQPATIFDIYYYYFNGYEDVIKSMETVSSSIRLPGLPTFTSRDLPSFLLPSNSNVYHFALDFMKEHIEILKEEVNPKILVNTFDALEIEGLKSLKKVKWLPIGPLIPLAFLGGQDHSDNSFGGDLFQKTSNYIEWMNLKEEGSVVYVSFGSISVLSNQQMEEIGQGLLKSNKPFLWVIREGNDGEKLQEKLSCRVEMEKQGMIVPWCSQVEVLSHRSLGCFVTHCGWNSSLESLASGVPVVAFPQWTDQATNAKLIKDVWKTGVRAETNEEGIVEADEIARCLEIVMGDGEEGEEMRNSAKKWKDLARKAVEEEGSSDENLRTFVAEL